MQIILF